MAEPKDIHEAMLAFQADPPVLTKDKQAHQSKYADLVQATEVILPRLNALGVVWKTWTEFLNDGKFVLRYELRHVASRTADAGTWPLKLSDNPQQMGSQVTYARRYALTVATGVAAENEDDDGQAASGRYAQRATQTRQRATSGQQTAQRGQRYARQGDGPPLPSDGPAGLTPQQRGMVQALFGRVGVQDRAARLNIAAQLAGRPLESSNELTRAEASALIDTLDHAAKQDDPGAALAEAMAAAAQQGGEDR